MFDICLLISFCVNTIYIWYLSHLEANDQLLHLKRFSVLVPECMYVISLIMQRLNDYFEWSWPIYLLRVSFVYKIFFALMRTFISQSDLFYFVDSSFSSSNHTYHDVIRNPGTSGLSGEPAAFLLHDSRQNFSAFRDSMNSSRGTQDPTGSRWKRKGNRSGEVSLRK